VRVRLFNLRIALGECIFWEGLLKFVATKPLIIPPNWCTYITCHKYIHMFLYEWPCYRYLKTLLLWSVMFFFINFSDLKYSQIEDQCHIYIFTYSHRSFVKTILSASSTLILIINLILIFHAVFKWLQWLDEWYSIR